TADVDQTNQKSYEASRGTMRSGRRVADGNAPQKGCSKHHSESRREGVEGLPKELCSVRRYVCPEADAGEDAQRKTPEPKKNQNWCRTKCDSIHFCNCLTISSEIAL